MLPQFAIALLSALTVAAGPVGTRCSSKGPGPTQGPAGTGPALVVTPALPVNGGATELPGPGSLAVKQIFLGHGIQNYTCSDAGAKATATGALAVLWDVKALYPGSGPQALSAADWTGLTVRTLYTTEVPLNLAKDAAHPFAANVASPFPAPVDLTVPGVPGPLKFAGHHYFVGTVPTFDISGTNPKISFIAKKDAGIPAPATADKGITGSGAVDWLQLGDAGGSTGASMVYRVLTAGGNAAACTAAGQTDSVPYTAQYWFFG